MVRTSKPSRLGDCSVLTCLRTLTDSDHLSCDPTNLAGCQRCIIRQPAVCCELCNPEVFQYFARSDPMLRPKRQRNRSHIPDYEADQYDMNLRDALNDFREQETIKKFGKSRLKHSGPGLIMPNDILQRIVDCVHAQKIINKDDLQLETRWTRIDLFADAVLAIIDICRRPSLTPGIANGDASATVAGAKKAPKVGQSRCGACGEIGHNSTYLNLCLNSIPLHVSLPQGQILVAQSIPRKAKRMSHRRLPSRQWPQVSLNSAHPILHLHLQHFPLLPLVPQYCMSPPFSQICSTILGRSMIPRLGNNYLLSMLE